MKRSILWSDAKYILNDVFEGRFAENVRANLRMRTIVVVEQLNITIISFLILFIRNSRVCFIGQRYGHSVLTYVLKVELYLAVRMGFTRYLQHLQKKKRMGVSKMRMLFAAVCEMHYLLKRLSC